MKILVILLTVLVLTGCRHDNDGGSSDQTVFVSANQENTATTPEPATLALMGVGLAAIFLLTCKKGEIKR